MERTLCDILRKGVDIGIVAEAYKRYVSRRDKNIPQLSEYAKKFRIEERVRRYLEVLIWKMQCNWKLLLKSALEATSQKRGSSEILKDYKHIISIVRTSDVMREQWKTYQKDFEYAQNIEFDEVCDVIVQMMNLYGLEKKMEV